MTTKLRHRIAVHEAGHAVIARPLAPAPLDLDEAAALEPVGSALNAGLVRLVVLGQPVKRERQLTDGELPFENLDYYYLGVLAAVVEKIDTGT
jgi:hypothetical protein